LIENPNRIFWKIANFLWRFLRHQKNEIWWDLSHLQKTENLFLMTFWGMFYFKKSRPGTPYVLNIIKLLVGLQTSKLEDQNQEKNLRIFIRKKS